MAKGKIRIHQKGYALTEVLIAGTIAASMLTVTATGLSTAIRANRDVQTLDQIIDESAQISAKIAGGLPLDTITEEYPGWNRSSQVRKQTGDVRQATASLVTHTFSRDESDGRQFSFMVSRLEIEDGP